MGRVIVVVIVVSAAVLVPPVGGASAAPAGATTLVSLSTADVQVSGPSFAPVVDDAGDVVFSSFAVLSPSDANGMSDVYVRTVGGQTILISRTAGGGAANDASEQPAISPDGRFIAFVSSATNLAGAAGNGKEQVFVYDRDPSGNGYDGADFSITLESATGSSAPGDGDSGHPSVATSGAEPAATAWVAFDSVADDLVSGDFNGVSDVFVRTGSATARVTVNANGAEADGPSFAPALTIDAGGVRHVVFESDADNLVVPDDSDGVRDVFAYDSSATPPLSQVSIAGSGGSVPDGASRGASVSTDGTKVAFTSVATNLVSGDTNRTSDVFVRDLSKATTTRVSVASDGTQADLASDSARISGDGKVVVFRSFADNLVKGDTNQLRDVFLTRVAGGQTVSLTVGSNGRSGEPSISTDGSFEAFSSDATNLAGSDTNPATDVFRREQDVVAPSAPTATVDANHVANSPKWSTDPTISFTVSDTDSGSIVSGVDGYSAVFDTHAATTPAKTINDPRTGTDTTITSTSLATNANWYFHVRAVDFAGNWGPTTTEGPYKIDVTPPSKPSITVAPWISTIATAPATSITLKWHSTDTGSGIRGYDLSYDRGAANASSAGWSSTTTLLTLSTATTKTLTVSTGYTYRFTVRAHDNVGKTTSATLEANIPVDNPALTRSSGWSTVADSNDFGGNALRATAHTAYITYKARHVDRIAVLGTTCPTCGAIEITLNGGTYFAGTRTHSGTHTKQVLFSGRYSFPQDPFQITIRVYGGGPVYIDGLTIEHA